MYGGMYLQSPLYLIFSKTTRLVEKVSWRAYDMRFLYNMFSEQFFVW
jgi:hypothetical protein